MGWLSRAAGAISGGISNAVSHPGDLLKHLNPAIHITGSSLNPIKNLKGIGGALKNPAQSITGFAGNMLDPSGMMGGVLGDPLDLFGDHPPPSPQVNPDLAGLKKQQQQYAQDFRAGIPGLQNQMVGQLRADTNRNLLGNLSAQKSADSARGLLYGGVHAGNEAKQRNQAAQGLMSGVSSINQGLQDEANQLDASAIQTGVSMQQQQQAMQNAIYQNAMAQQQGQNQIFGGLLSAAAMIALA